MKAGLLLLGVGVTLANGVIFSVVPGCATFRALPLAIGWHVLGLIRGDFFADNHVHMVAVVAAILSACFVTGLMAVVAFIARKTGRLASERSVTKLLVIGGAVYVALGLLPIPIGPCF